MWLVKLGLCLLCAECLLAARLYRVLILGSDAASRGQHRSSHLWYCVVLVLWCLSLVVVAWPQGALRAYIPANDKTQEGPGFMARGDIGWAGGGPGPDFFIYLGAQPAAHFGRSHTVSV